MAKDSLARGARSATFAGGVGEGDIYRNLSKEEREKDPVFAPQASAPHKRFRPLKGILLVRRVEADATSGSIFIPDTVGKEVPAEGFVLGAGEDTPASYGQRIVFGKYAGTEFRLNGETLLLMRSEDVLGIIEDEPIRMTAIALSNPLKNSIGGVPTGRKK